MGQRGARRRELHSWHTMNENREYDHASSPIAENFIPPNSSPRSRSPRGAGRRRAATTAATPVAVRPSPTLEELLASSCELDCTPRPRLRPRPLRSAQGGVEGEDEAPLAVPATGPYTGVRAAAAAFALGLSFSAPSFPPCACPAPAASALAASSSFDERGPRGRGRRSAGAAPGPQQPRPREAVVFNLMVVGCTGLGKSTLLHAMFANEVFSEHFPGPCPRIKKTLQVQSSQAVVEAAGLRLRLTLVDTPGLGDAVDNSKCFKPILTHIDDRNYDFFSQKADASSTAPPDPRIHCCLYFIEPTGHGLKRLDIECMRKLHDRVNVIPVIAKADTMTSFECYRFKKRLRQEIEEHQLNVYDFPEVNAKGEKLRSLKDRLPFAVVSSNTVVEENGRKMLARRYPWGIAEIENLEHSDFSLLRKVLLQTHLHDLKEVTNIHYESFCCRKLTPITFDDFKKMDCSNKKKYK